MEALVLTISDAHMVGLFLIIAMAGLALMLHGIYIQHQRSNSNGCRFIIGMLVFLMSGIVAMTLADKAETVKREAKQLTEKHADLPNQWFDIFDELSVAKSPQLKDIVLRKRIATFDCTGTLPMAGFDRFMGITQGAAAETLEPCLQLEGELWKSPSTQP